MEKINLRDCDLMTIKEWNEAVNCGMITSDDGIGYYATSEGFIDLANMVADNIGSHGFLSP